MADSFLWYDLETFGRDPRRTRIAQFAAIRTDLELNPIGEPISLFCQPAARPAALARSDADHRHHAAAGAARRPARSRVLRPRARGTGAAGHLRGRLQLAPLRRRVHPLRPVPQLPRRLRARVAQRQLALGPARRDAADARAAPGRHGMAAARGRRAQLQARAPGRRQRHPRGHGARGAVRRARADRPGAAACALRSRGCGTTRCSCATSATSPACSTRWRDAGAAHLRPATRRRAIAPRWCCRWRGIRASSRG